MKRDKSFKIFIAVFIVTISVAVIYGFNKNTNDVFYGEDRAVNNYTVNSSNDTMLEPDNNSSRPVKGMKYKDSMDSLAFSKHIDLSNIDGDNFYSREINEGLTSGKVNK